MNVLSILSPISSVGTSKCRDDHCGACPCRVRTFDYSVCLKNTFRRQSCSPSSDELLVYISLAVQAWSFQFLDSMNIPWYEFKQRTWVSKACRSRTRHLGYSSHHTRVWSKVVKASSFRSLSEILCERSHTIKFIPGKDTYDDRQSHTGQTA